MDKIIYTRCSPWIDITKDGQISKSEGFGIAATSKDFMKSIDGCSKILLLKFLEERKCDPNYYEKLYEYASIGNDVYILNAVSELPFCNENRPNGSSHRPIFMAEAIVGKFNYKPGLYLTKENFLGNTISQNDYYRLDYGINEQPFILDTVDESNLIQALADESFFTEQRKNILEKLICYVMEQVNLPLNKQKPMFIKDSNENVINYIRAISNCLPTSIVKKVTFLTHTTSFKNNPERYAYYVENDGNITEYNSFAQEQKVFRKLKYMIIGFTNGNINRNQASEFELIDDRVCTYNPIIGTFIHDIVNKKESAILFLNSLDDSFNFDLKNIDEAYKMFKDINCFDQNAPFFEVVDFVSKFTNSNYNNASYLPKVCSNLKIYYESHMLYDGENSFILLDKIKELDINLAKTLMINIYQLLAKEFSNSLIQSQYIELYDQLDRKGYITESIKNDKILPCISSNQLMNIINENYSVDLVKIYLNLFIESLKLSNQIVTIESNNGRIFTILINKYLMSSGDILSIITKYLKANVTDYDKIFEETLKELIEKNENQKVEKLVDIYKPELSNIKRNVFIAKFNKNASFKTFENEFCNKVRLSLKNIDEYFETLIEFFGVYQDELNNDFSGLEILKLSVELVDVKTQHNYFNYIINYVLKLKEIKRKNNVDMLSEIIEKLNYKVMLFGLKNNDMITSLDKLNLLCDSYLTKLINVKNDLLKCKDEKKQVAILNSLNDSNLNIPFEYLNTTLMKELISSLIFGNYPVHFDFIRLFAIEDELSVFVKTYLNKIFEQNKLDKVALYYSLCLVRCDNSSNELNKKISKQVNTLIKIDDGIISKCFEKNIEKTIKKYKNFNNDEALKLLIDEYNNYSEKNKGFFAKLFGKKKDDK